MINPKKLLPTISSCGAFVFVDKEFLSGTGTCGAGCHCSMAAF